MSRAGLEIADVERISREALTELRRAVYGFRAATLSDELIRARGVLLAAGITLDAHAEIVPSTGALPTLTPEVEQATALILRESVTNVIRHSRATTCRIAVTRDGDSLCLEVRDNGVGAGAAIGGGIEGMRARAREVGGLLEHDGSHGTAVRLRVAWPEVREATA